MAKEIAKAKGTVKVYFPDRGYGFITGDDGKEYFVHESELEVAVEKDDKVEFKPGETAKGLKAEKVKKL
jgi:CspA family cold shock protein